MNSRIHIQSELTELNSSLPFNVKMPVFNVPEGYFENFANGVLAIIKGKQAVSLTEELASVSPLLAGLSREMPFSVPDNYFDEVAQNLSELTGEVHLSDALSVYGKVTPFEVPDRYFDSLAQQVLAKVSKKKPATKIISIKHKWIRFSVAAILIGLVALSGILYFADKSSVNPGQHQPESWVAKKLKNVSNQELQEFITTIYISNEPEIAKSEKKRNIEVQQMLKDVSDAELEIFLSQVPSVNGEELLIN